MRRRTFLTASAAVCLAGCSRRPESGERPLVRVLVMPRSAMASFYLADEEGYFTGEGLDIETHTMNRSMQMIPLLADGQFDVAMIGMSPAVINAVDRGARLKIVAAREFTSTTCGTPDTLFGSARSFPNGLKDPAEIRGKRVALSGRQTNNEFVLDMMLEEARLTQDDIEIVMLEQNESIAALFAHRIDAMISSHLEKDPAAVSNEYVKGPGMVDFLPDQQRGFIAFGPSLLDADHDIGVRFLAAYLRGANAYAEGKTPAFLERIARASRLDPEMVLAACRDHVVRDGHVDLPSIQRFIDWTIRKGYCRDTVTADQLVDTTYISELQRRSPQPPDAGAAPGQRAEEEAE